MKVRHKRNIGFQTKGNEIGQRAVAARFAAELVKLLEQHRDRLLAAENQHQVELLELERRQLVALARLWKRQGRELGPGMLRALEAAHGS